MSNFRRPPWGQTLPWSLPGLRIARDKVIHKCLPPGPGIPSNPISNAKPIQVLVGNRNSDQLGNWENLNPIRDGHRPTKKNGTLKKKFTYTTTSHWGLVWSDPFAARFVMICPGANFWGPGEDCHGRIDKASIGGRRLTRLSKKAAGRPREQKQTGQQYCGSPTIVAQEDVKIVNCCPSNGQDRVQSLRMKRGTFWPNIIRSH